MEPSGAVGVQLYAFRRRAERSRMSGSYQQIRLTWERRLVRACAKRVYVSAMSVAKCVPQPDHAHDARAPTLPTTTTVSQRLRSAQFYVLSYAQLMYYRRDAHGLSLIHI